MTSKAGASRNVRVTARTEPVGTPMRPTVADLAGELEAVQCELAATKLERDDYRQEMFESNRHAAWLTHQSRDLNQAPPRQVQSSDPVDESVYTAYLEARLWAFETDRLRMMRYVQYLEELCWDLETRRPAKSDAAAMHCR